MFPKLLWTTGVWWGWRMFSPMQFVPYIWAWLHSSSGRQTVEAMLCNVCMKKDPSNKYQLSVHSADNIFTAYCQTALSNGEWNWKWPNLCSTAKLHWQKCLFYLSEYVSCWTTAASVGEFVWLWMLYSVSSDSQKTHSNTKYSLPYLLGKIAAFVLTVW